MTAQTPAGVLDLAARIEAATGADREVDRLIEETRPGVLRHSDHTRTDAHRKAPNDEWAYVISGDGHPDYPPGQGYPSPRYTASLDAAMTLVPEGMRWAVDTFSGKAEATIAIIDDATGYYVGDESTSHAVTPALALTAAALRARAQAPQ